MYPHTGLAVQPHSSGGSRQAHICVEKQESSGKYKHFTALIVDGIDFPSPAISQSVSAFTALSVLLGMSYCKHNFHIDPSDLNQCMGKLGRAETFIYFVYVVQFFLESVVLLRGKNCFTLKDHRSKIALLNMWWGKKKIPLSNTLS